MWRGGDMHWRESQKKKDRIYVHGNEREAGGKLETQGGGVLKVNDFKHLGSTMQSNRQVHLSCAQERVKKKLQTG